MAISKEIEAVVLPVIDRFGCDFVQGTFRREKNGWVLRLLIERRGADPEKGSGVDLGLCSSISRDISAILDVEEVIDRKFNLEVSSPGLDRPLVHARDFDRFAGRPVALKTKRAIEGRRRFKGTLGGSSDGAVIITIGEGQTVTIPHDFIEKANLVFEPKGFEESVGER